MEVIECRSCSRADECYLGKSYVNLEALFAGCGGKSTPGDLSSHPLIGRSSNTGNQDIVQPQNSCKTNQNQLIQCQILT